jgi:uncharacterized protein YegL
MDENKGKLLPVYFVADDSGSMEDVIGEFNAGLTSLLDAMTLDAMGAAKIRFTVLSFSDDVLVHMELADLRHVEQMPKFKSRNSTCYSVAFNDLRARIDRDVEQLVRDGYQVHRPAVFFLTDGEPNSNDPWRPALSELKSPVWKRHPNVVAFGIGKADAAIINEVATRPEYGWMATGGGADTGKVLAKFFESFTTSLMNSAKNPGELQMDKPEGFSMAVDLIQ